MSSEAPPQLKLTELPDLEFAWKTDNGSYYKLDHWIWNYRVRRMVQGGGYEAILYVEGGTKPYRIDEFRGPNAAYRALKFCEAHAFERIGFTEEQKAAEIERVRAARTGGAS